MERLLIIGGVTFVATCLFLGGHVLFFHYTKAGRAYRRKLGKLIAGPEWGRSGRVMPSVATPTVAVSAP